MSRLSKNHRGEALFSSFIRAGARARETAASGADAEAGAISREACIMREKHSL